MTAAMTGGHRRGHRRPSLLAPVAAMAMALAGCSSSTEKPATRPQAPRPAPVVNVVMSDFRFELDRAVPAGRVVFRFGNRGGAAHSVIMLPLSEDLPPIEVQLAGSERRFVQPYAGISDRLPGDTGTFAVDLAPGMRYAFMCPIVEADGEPHWKKGMTHEFRTRK